MLFHTLSNGLRILHIEVDNLIAHSGVIINVGSRDEEESEQGMAHFIEHMIFKGTSKRRAYHILSRLEDAGGELNAFTTKEDTFIYASFLKEDYSKTFDLFGDILFNSIFPEKEIKKEKAVILDEIESYKDSPSEQIFDDFEDLIFSGHPLGRNILGTPDHVRGFKRKDIVDFVSKNYSPQNMILCSVGNIKNSRLIHLAEKYFGNIPAGQGRKERKHFKKYSPEQKTDKKDTYQSHCVIGNTGYSVTDKKRIPLALLNNILGGPGMSSRLNLGIREKYGFTYSIESNYTAYSDTGILSIYLATDKNYLNKSIQLVHKELKKLRDQKLGSLQLHKAKKQLIGQIAIARESNVGRMINMGKSMLLLNRVDDIETIYGWINEVSAEQLLEIANEVFDPGQLSMLVYQGK